MVSLQRKTAVFSGIAALPAMLFFVRYFLLRSSGWHTPELQHDLIFHLLRAATVPLLIFLVARFCVDLSDWTRLVAVHAALYISWSVLFVAVAFVIFRFGISPPDDRIKNMINTIYQSTLPVNPFLYVAVVTGFSAWVYYERFRATELIVRESSTRRDTAAEPIEKKVLERIQVKTGNKTLMIPVNSIILFEADGPYTRVFRTDSSHLVTKTLTKLQQILPESFQRVHRSRIINESEVRAIQSLTNGDFLITMTDGRQVRGSRTYRKQINRLKQ